MTDLPISKELAARLQQIANQEEKTLEAVLSDFVEEWQQAEKTKPAIVSSDTMMNFAQRAEKLNIQSGMSNISSQFDDHIEEAIEEHFKNRRKDE